MNTLNGNQIGDNLQIYDYDIKSQLDGLKAEVDQLDQTIVNLNTQIQTKNAQIATLQQQLADCQNTTPPPPPPPPPTVETYFAKDFTGVTLSPKSNNTGMNFNNWGLNELDECSASLNFISGNVTNSILASIVKDPKEAVAMFCKELLLTMILIGQVLHAFRWM